MLLHNHIQLIGRIGHQPELVTLTDGTARTILRLYQDSNGSDSAKETQAHTLVGWNALATQLHQRLRRGDTVLVHGRLVNRRLTINGQITLKSEVHVGEFRLLSSRSITRSVGIAAEPVQQFTRSYE